MEILRSQYDRTQDVLDLPCFKFRGRGATPEGRNIDQDTARALLTIPARPFAQAILGVASSLRFKNKKQRADVIIVPETTFDFNPTPNAFTMTAGPGKVVINFGMYLSMRTMPYTISWLKSIYEGTTKMSLDDISDLAIPSQLLDELEGVLHWWRRFHLTGTLDPLGILRPSMTSEEAKTADRTISQIFYFISFHEFAHWVSVITPPEDQRDVVSKTQAFLAAWPSEDVLTDPATKQQVVKFFQQDPRVFDDWVEEMLADSLAVQYCLGYFPHYFEEHDFQRVKQQVFAAQALVYSLLIRLSEAFYECVLRRPLSWRTHPPSALRENIFCYIGGKVRGKSQAEFAVTDWGVGTFIGLVMDRAMEALRLKIEGDRHPAPPSDG